MNKPKVIVILGPNASGKSDLAVNLAKFIIRNKKKFHTNGAEIISADSRQVYKGLNLSSGKITQQEMRGIKHHLIDVISPKKIYSVAQYQKLGQKIINKLTEENKIPIICGGTGLYIDSLIYKTKFPEIKPNFKLRKKLEKMPTEKLLSILKKLDKKRASGIDPKNKRRLIRAIEIVKTSGKPVPPIKKGSDFNIFKIGIKPDKNTYHDKILRRIEERIKKGMIKEITKIHRYGVSWKRLEELGLEFKWISKLLREEVSKEEMILNLFSETKKYAKRQMTWWKKDQTINWIYNTKKAPLLVESFLKN